MDVGVQEILLMKWSMNILNITENQMIKGNQISSSNRKRLSVSMKTMVLPVHSGLFDKNKVIASDLNMLLEKYKASGRSTPISK